MVYSFDGNVTLVGDWHNLCKSLLYILQTFTNSSYLRYPSSTQTHAAETACGVAWPHLLSREEGEGKEGKGDGGKPGRRTTQTEKMKRGNGRRGDGEKEGRENENV